MRTRFASMFGACWGRLAACTAVLSLAGVAASHGAESAAALKLRFGGDQTQTRVVLELDQAARAEVVSDGAQDGHVVLTFAKLKVGDDLDGQGKGLVKAWSLEKGLGKARLSFDLSRHGRITRRFLLPPSDGVTSYRYVMDIEAEGAAPPPQPAPTAPQPARTRVLKASSILPSAPVVIPDPEAPAQVAGLQKVSLTDLLATPRKSSVKTAAKAVAAKKVIVIDAGHGGHDPGALGNRSHEKDVTLAAARTLKARLERSGRFRVVLTRDSDVYVPLENRVKIARAAGADLFISLHADSGGDPKVRGATVYTLSDHGVDRATHSVFNGGFIDVQLPGRDLSVKQILLDLTQRTTRNRSGAFAETLLEHISTETPLLRRSHRDAGYMVLLAPDVPAVLLEMGFITSPEDEAQLNDADRREKLMGAVAEAIEGYFADPASAPTQVATQ
ncbi:MAG: N-acetylmuramoyl-L-alanine amidase [Caulobacteraceae bacterium]|nr:N-acetylmuramoyl-L-alanine amidase [Caulobacteraceae bacterium]